MISQLFYAFIIQYLSDRKIDKHLPLFNEKKKSVAQFKSKDVIASFILKRKSMQSQPSHSIVSHLSIFSFLFSRFLLLHYLDVGGKSLVSYRFIFTRKFSDCEFCDEDNDDENGNSTKNGM